MFQKQNQLYSLIIAAITLLILTSIKVIYAQENINLICASSTPQSTMKLPGTYFHLVEVPYDLETNSNYRFEAVSASGNKEYVFPLSPEMSRDLYTPSISPDGHYIVFRPASSDVGLTVWDLETDVVTSLPLQPSDLAYLTLDFTTSYQRNQNLLVWLDSRHLLLQYYYHDSPASSVDWVIGQKIFTIQENLFAIIEGKRENFNFPTLPLPASSLTPRIEFSPNRHYVTQLTEHLLWGDYGSRSQFEIYDVQNQTRVYDIVPTIERYPVDRPVWMPDENSVFILTDGQRSKNIGLRKVVELQTEDKFSEDQNLQQAIIDTFGADAGFTSMMPIVSPSGAYIMFGLYVRATKTSYLLRYEPTTKQITAFCDPGPGANYDETYPFWYQNEQYFAYYNNGQVYVINLLDDAFYTLPSEHLFIGWSDQDIFTSSISQQQ